ncbi:MAG: thiol peroxidase [Nitrospina sp.]|jgi:thioredoxin-dependent peroxiredoxin|nr:thiol peroxidase [Nitrospina sp.]MBT3508772.1 thiol peroxidase [Nitrospina sp.]MBT3874596.1 thiol peroxidase [Nitrospina sp.]MBT4047070.1 thiol peroxidase [Nitrospina sp.]MBT4557908.1 thiol peroxidase [Nitrospina sp.]
MSQKIFFAGRLILAAFLVFAGTSWGEQVVTLRGKPLTLMGEEMQVGQTLPTVHLPDLGLSMIDLKSFKGKVTILSVVPSLDTPTCEKQTHILSEENKGLDASANLVTISRDLPFAQKRFAKKANIHNILFLSDYRNAEFGMSMGLLIEENRLLARAIIVLDREGVIRYLEVVPDLARLPEMEKAFEFARSL